MSTVHPDKGQRTLEDVRNRIRDVAVESAAGATCGRGEVGLRRLRSIVDEIMKSTKVDLEVHSRDFSRWVNAGG